MNAKDVLRLREEYDIDKLPNKRYLKVMEMRENIGNLLSNVYDYVMLGYPTANTMLYQNPKNVILGLLLIDPYHSRDELKRHLKEIKKESDVVYPIFYKDGKKFFKLLSSSDKIKEYNWLYPELKNTYKLSNLERLALVNFDEKYFNDMPWSKVRFNTLRYYNPNTKLINKYYPVPVPKLDDGLNSTYKSIYILRNI